MNFQLNQNETLEDKPLFAKGMTGGLLYKNWELNIWVYPEHDVLCRTHPNTKPILLGGTSQDVGVIDHTKIAPFKDENGNLKAVEPDFLIPLLGMLTFRYSNISQLVKTVAFQLK